MAGDVGDAVFDLLPRLLQVLPCAPTRSAAPSPLTALYPALLSAAAADPALTPLAALSPLLAHVAAAAVVDRAPAAADAAAALGAALARRAPASVAAFLRDLCVLLAATRAGARGRVAVFAAFADAATAAEDVVVPGGGGGDGGGGGKASAAWPATPLVVDCDDGTASALVHLIVRLVRSPAWVRVGSRVRALVVCDVLSARGVASGALERTSAEEEDARAFARLLLALRDAATSGVPLPRPLALQVDAMLAELRREEVEASRPAAASRSAQVTPPTKKRRRVPSTPGTGTGSRVEDRLQAVSGMAWGPEACALVARLCVTVLRDKDGVNGSLDVSAMALEVGVNLLSTAVGQTEEETAELWKATDASAALSSYLDLAASLLEVAAIAQGRYARHCELESTRRAVPSGGGTATAMSSSGLASALDCSDRGTFGGHQKDAGARTVHPQDATALAAAAGPTLSLLEAIPHFAAARSSAPGSTDAAVIIRASMILWRLSNMYVAFLRVDKMRSDHMLDDDDQGTFSTFLRTLRGRLVVVAASMEKVGLEPGSVSCPAARSALLRSAARTMACEASSSISADAELSASRLEAVIRECLAADCPSFTAGALAALADVICASSQCRHGCVVETESQTIPAGVVNSCSRNTWAALYQLVEPLIKGAGHDMIAGAAARVLCRLVIHAPAGKLGVAGAELVQAVWHPLSHRARREASSALPRIFAASGTGSADMTSESDAHVASGRSGVLRATEDSWDGPERAFQVDGTAGGFGVIAKLLGTELQEQLSNRRPPNMDPMSLGLLARIGDRGRGAESKVVGIAWEALLRVAVRDQMNARLRVTGDGQGVHTTSSAPAFQAWDELAFVSCSVDGLVSREFAMNDEGLVLLGYRSFSSNSKTSVGNLQQAWDHSVADVIARSLVSRYKNWLPISLGCLLGDDAFTARLVTVVGERSVAAFWDKVPRFALGAVLRDGNAVTLESLALRVNRPAKDLVNRVCADALARTALQSDDAFVANVENKSIQVIELVMGMTISDVIESRVGKIVQRIVMELGAGRDDIVKRALSQVSQTLSVRRTSQATLTADELVVEHFLLVMDAVNRGIFAPRVPMSERLRCLSVLDSVLQLCHKSLNLFIAKVMATLKTCLRIEGADRTFRDAVCRVWVTFMSALGPARLGPHLGQVISILAPLLGQHHRTFAPAICDVFVKHKDIVAPYFPSISLLVSTVAHPSFAPVAEVVLAGVKASVVGVDGDTPGSEVMDKYVTNLDEVLTQATTHDSAAIRSLALDHMLTLLQSRRGWLLTCMSASGDDIWENVKKDLLRRLVHGFTGLLLHADWSVRDRAIRCLGEVGAIDPVRLGDRALSGHRHKLGSSSLSPKRRNLPSSVRTLSIDLLKDYLVPALHRGDLPGAGNRLNRLGLAVQELLRVCGCGPETPAIAKELSGVIVEHIALFGDAWEQDRDLESEKDLAAHFWARLPDDVKEAAHPYLSCPFDTSAYNVRAAGSATEGEGGVPFAQLAEQTLQARGRIWARLSAAALGDVERVQASEWRMQMTAQLTDYVGDRGCFGCLFKALRPILRYEDALSSYLLPLVIVDALECSIEKSEPNSSPMVLSFILGEIKDAMDAGGEAAQSVFLLLDTLRNWRDIRGGRLGRERYREERERHSTGAGGAPRRRLQITENELIEKAVSSDVLSRLVDLEGRSDLSLMILAKAAHRCRAYSRAILYAEQYVLNIRRSAGIEAWPAFVKEMIGGARHARHQGDEENLTIEEQEAGENTFSSEVRISETAKNVATQRDAGAESDALTLLQLCYAELEDADSMSGIAALRQDTGLSETILDAEASGNFDDALLCYERALAASPGDGAMHAGFLRCLRTLGHWETMLAHAEGLSHKTLSVHDSPGAAESLKESTMALGIEAAWRLGRWDRVDELCRDTSVHNSLSGSSAALASAAGSSIALTVRGDVSASPAHSITDAGRWEALYGTAVGEMLSCVRRRDVAAIQSIASRARSYLLSPAANAAMEGFARAYPLIVKLHSLADIEDAMLFECGSEQPLAKDMENATPRAREGYREKRKASLTNRLVGMHSRSEATASSLRVREPILSCRRVCLELMGRQSEAAEVGLQLAGLARESGNLRAAASAAFRAVSSAPKHSDEWFAASAETARIMAAKGDKTSALLSLEKDIDRMSSLLRSCDASDGAAKALETAARHRLASAHVLAGKWIEEARSAPVKEIVKHYQTATELAPALGDPFYALGRFYDSLLRCQAEGTSNRAKYVPAVLSSFTEALRLGHGWVFEILPRMLTVCFDFFSKVEVDLRNGRSVDNGVVRKAERATQRAFQILPKYMWMTVVPQLMSRVLHPSEFVREQLRELLASIVTEFPDQAIWMIAPSSQLAAKERKQVAADILNKAVQLARRGSGGKTTGAQAKSRAATLKATARNGLCVIKQLINVCSHILPKDRRGRADDCSHEFGPLRKDLQLSEVIVPTLAALTVAIPTRSAPQRHEPFAPEPVTIADMETMVLVMSSLMRPRRIGFIGSDGKSYRFLAKREAAGDMRKDSRLIDFLTVVNRLLAKDQEAQQRELHIKTYAVLPLTEETGLIEWVNDIVPLRTLVRGEQQRIGKLPDSGTVQAKHNSMSKQRFHDEWGVPSHPAVLDKFFLRQFGSDPQEWLAARNLWTRSVAAWSMTGYVVGLGDRHGENLLIETTTGMCVHVDFAMLFDKGMTLKVPEIVPFRLTHNMVGAMGISGYEGSFRQVSEIVLGVLRGNADALMGVLEAFLHDPLADWARGKSSRGAQLGRSSSGQANGGADELVGDEGGNFFAAEMRRAVELKLRGVYGRGEGELPLSIKGQVQRLIHEATSTANLAQMYIWWGAWGM